MARQGSFASKPAQSNALRHTPLPPGTPQRFSSCVDPNELRGYPMFRAIPLGELDRMCAVMRARVFPASAEVISAGDPRCDSVYFLLSGSAQVVQPAGDGRTIRIADVEPGEVFGDLSAFDRQGRSAGVETSTICRIGVMDSEAFIANVTGSAELALTMFRMVAHRIRRQNLRYYENTFLDLRQRIVAELLRRIVVVQGGGLVQPAPRQIDLANLLGVRRESVAREFGRLMRDGLLERTNLGIVVPDVAALKRLLPPSP